MQITIEDLGVSDMLKSYAMELEAKLHKGISEGGQVVTDEAIALCPYDTGELRKSIHKTVNGLHCDIGTNKEYAMYVEFGTCKMSAQPYLVPALENKANEVVEIVKESLK